MSSYRDPRNTPGALPDIDDPAAVQRWMANLEAEAAHLDARRRTVLSMAKASHDIYLLKNQPLPLWRDDSARMRAYGLIIAGTCMAAASANTLTHLSAIEPGDIPVLAFLPVMLLVWLFICFYEIVQGYQFRSRLRAAASEKIQALTIERDLAKALLEDGTFPGQLPITDATENQRFDRDKPEN